jgi:CO/xanthine dehydrogenase Mo-binding subunit
MRGQLVYTMGVPDDKIDVIAEDVGGGFGVRFNMYPEYCAVLLAAKKTGRPVKWTGSRSEVFPSRTTGHGRGERSELALDARKRLRHPHRRPRRYLRPRSVHQHAGRSPAPPAPYDVRRSRSWR